MQLKNTTILKNWLIVKSGYGGEVEKLANSSLKSVKIAVENKMDLSAEWVQNLVNDGIIDCYFVNCNNR